MRTDRRFILPPGIHLSSMTRHRINPSPKPGRRNSTSRTMPRQPDGMKVLLPPPIRTWHSLRWRGRCDACRGWSAGRMPLKPPWDDAIHGLLQCSYCCSPCSRRRSPGACGRTGWHGSLRRWQAVFSVGPEMSDCRRRKTCSLRGSCSKAFRILSFLKGTRFQKG